MEFVAILVEMPFSMWKFVLARIGMLILFTTRAEKYRFSALHVKMVCTSPSMIRSDSPSTCMAVWAVGRMWRQRSTAFLLVIRLEVTPVSRSKWEVLPVLSDMDRMRLS